MTTSSDDFGGMSLFDDMVFEPIVHVPQNGVPTFWTALENQGVGVNTVGKLWFAGLLNDQFDELKLKKEKFRRDGGHLSPGVLHVRAVPMDGGAYQLEGSLTPGPGVSHRVYWLPFQQTEVTRATRAWYENSNCEYFMTSSLTGCRFVLTHNEVLHVANNAGARTVEQVGSESRTNAEFGAIGNQRARRASTSGHSQDSIKYGTGGWLFGMRTPGNVWVYKLLRKDTNTWSILQEPGI